MMFFDPDLVVQGCADLSIGDDINAWQGGHLFHTGTVTDLLPAMGLFWIRERALGERRLLDMSELEITRVLHPALQEALTAATWKNKQS
ncbi:hypothetical protein [Arthrobacter sp. NPDC056727]|uniref:hypothetical protein n=1 Tax=Arthrobacter sp. NPDC056727 TaxID=3345927 RepID=UPI00366A9F38